MSQNLLLEDLIQKALSKINGTKKDLCRFLQVSIGRHMHHFTFEKMKKDCPQQLFDLIKEYVIEPETPQEIHPNSTEQLHQTNKKMKQFNISEDELERILYIARQAQDVALTEKLEAKQGFYSEDDLDI